MPVERRAMRTTIRWVLQGRIESTPTPSVAKCAMPISPKVAAHFQDKDGGREDGTDHGSAGSYP